MTVQPQTSTGPTAVGVRALGPDLARGLLLLFIALANTHTFLHRPDGSTIRSMPVVGTFADQVVAAVLTTVVDGRSYTMFAALFGYGLVQITRRQDEAGAEPRATRKILRRRGRWMVLIGFAHAVLLFYGDILAAYGLLAVLLVATVRSSSRRLAVYAVLWTLAGAAIYGFFSLPMSYADTESAMPFLTEHNPLVAAWIRAFAICVSAPVLAITSAGAFLVGIWAARRRLLEDPDRHLVALRRFVAVGIGVSVLGGLPLALAITGVIDDTGNQVLLPVGVLHSLTGYAGGPAYAVAIALWARKLTNDGSERRPLVLALQATGQRSMTCYLAQSVVWLVAFAPYLLDLGPALSVWQAALLAIATWAATVVLADWMRRTGRRGPFETFLRRRTYRAKT